MTLRELLENQSVSEVHGNAAVPISSLTCDSRAVLPGTLFFALRGAQTDGHRYIEQAVAAGAAAVVLEDPAFAPAGLPWASVPDGRAAMGRISVLFNGDPTATKPLIGITGTNGKTTTTYLLEAILGAAGKPAAVLGTISYRFGATTITASHTTPESTELQLAFRRLADAGAQAFVMEVSSHALEQRRVDGCSFDNGVFTNLTRDHLDYHLTMEAYLASKVRLFAELLAADRTKPRRRAAVNCDDPLGVAVAAAAACPVITYGLGDGAEVTAEKVSFSVTGIAGVLTTPAGRVPFRSPMLGRFNLANILAAAAAGYALELPLEAIRRGIEGNKQVPGRLERVENNRGVALLVDYAHTGDALENVLKTLREIATARIITLFGCGGDRDQGKRPIMGRIAAELSEL